MPVKDIDFPNVPFYGIGRWCFALDYDDLPECSLYEAMSTPVNTYYLKNYRGWTNKIPRKTLSKGV